MLSTQKPKKYIEGVIYNVQMIYTLFHGASPEKRVPARIHVMDKLYCRSYTYSAISGRPEKILEDLKVRGPGYMCFFVNRTLFFFSAAGEGVGVGQNVYIFAQ